MAKQAAKSPSRFRSWLSSRSAKITAISLGAAVALGLAFTGGAVAAKSIFEHREGPSFANGFERDGDHGPEFDGKRPPKPGHGPEGQEGPGGKFQLDADQPASPDSSPQSSTTNP